MDPVLAGILLALLGVAVIALSIALIRRWNRENRAKYPERVSPKFFEINREPRH